MGSSSHDHVGGTPSTREITAYATSASSRLTRPVPRAARAKTDLGRKTRVISPPPHSRSLIAAIVDWAKKFHITSPERTYRA